MLDLTENSYEPDPCPGGGGGGGGVQYSYIAYRLYCGLRTIL